MDYPPVSGGISAHVYELSKVLQAKGHRITIVTRRRAGQDEYSIDSGLEIYRVSLRYLALLYGLQIRSFVRKLLAKVQPDIIHIHGMGPLEWYNIDMVPLVYTNHTSGYLKRVNKGGFRRMTMMKNHFNKVDLFLAPSKELLEVPFAIAAPKMFIANGVDSSKYIRNNEKRQAIRGHHGFQEDDIVAIVTRRLVDKNGVIYLARAASLLANTRLKFLVIGDGPERVSVESEFRQHCGERAHFLGNKTHDQIIAYYSAADFSVLPSLMEATSISGLEAMSASLPLVGTRVGGIPELIEDNKNGFLCNPADPFDLAEKINMLTTGDLQKFGKFSRKLAVDRFDWQRIGEKTLGAYRQVAIGKRKN